MGPLIAPYFWTLCGHSLWVSKPGWFSHLHTHLLACSEPKGSCLVLHLPFPPIGGVHCISVYTAGLPSGQPSGKQQMAGNGGC